MEQAREFFSAIQKGDIAAVKALLSAHPGLAAANNDQGQSAILFSIYNRKPEILQLLLAQRADLGARTNDGKSALQFAEERGHKEVTALLRGGPGVAGGGDPSR